MTRNTGDEGGTGPLTEVTTSILKREALLARLERLTELPLLILAFVMLPLLVGPFLWDLSATEEATFYALDTFIWALFAADLALKVMVAPNKPAYLRANWLDVLIVVIPFARPLRLLRLVVYSSRAITGAWRFAHADFLLVYAIGLIMLGATLVTTLEQGNGSSLDDFPDALWWSVVTITTVGYGDLVPETASGKAIAMALMIGGIGIFGGLTANLASFFVRSGDEEAARATRELSTEVNRLRQEVSRLVESANR